MPSFFSRRRSSKKSAAAGSDKSKGRRAAAVAAAASGTSEEETLLEAIQGPSTCREGRLVAAAPLLPSTITVPAAREPPSGQRQQPPRNRALKSKRRSSGDDARDHPPAQPVDPTVCTIQTGTSFSSGTGAETPEAVEPVLVRTPLPLAPLAVTPNSESTLNSKEDSKEHQNVTPRTSPSTTGTMTSMDHDHDYQCWDRYHEGNEALDQLQRFSNSLNNASSRTLNSEEMRVIMETASIATMDSSTSSPPGAPPGLILRQGSMVSNTSSAISPQRFFIQAVDEEDLNSIPSKVNMMPNDSYEDDEDDYAGPGRSESEWMSIVRTLYESLQLADSKLSTERQRRRAREKNLVKLARELSKRNDAIASQNKLVDKLREQLVVERTEKSLLDHRLRHYMYVYGEERTDQKASVSGRQGLQEEIMDLEKQHEVTCEEYESRIRKMNKAHGRQCDDLCREIIDANRENIRLKQQIADLSPTSRSGTSTTRNRNLYSLASASRRSPWRLRDKKKNISLLRLLLAVVVFGICALSQHSGVLSNHRDTTNAAAIQQHGTVPKSSSNIRGLKNMVTAPILPSEPIRNVVKLDLLSSDNPRKSDTDSTSTQDEGMSSFSVDDAATGIIDVLFVEAGLDAVKVPKAQAVVTTQSAAPQRQQEPVEGTPVKIRTPLRKRTGKWLRNRVANFGSRLRNVFIKNGAGQQMNRFLQARGETTES